MDEKSEKSVLKSKLYYKTYSPVDYKYGYFTSVHFDQDLFDDISVSLNSEENITYDRLLKQLKRKYDVVLIGCEKHPTQGSDKAIFVTPPEERERTINNTVFKSNTFKLVVSKTFVMKNKKAFLGLLGKLVSEEKITNIRGSISYDLNEKHHFINLNFAINDSSVPYMQQIRQNFDNINCVFKYAKKEVVFLFCEIITRLYSVDKKTAKFLPYSISFYKEGQEYPLPEISIFINKAGNVFIHSCPEKTLVLTREIYAKNLKEGLDILKSEMKNLGFDIKVVEKRRIR